MVGIVPSSERSYEKNSNVEKCLSRNIQHQLQPSVCNQRNDAVFVFKWLHKMLEEVVCMCVMCCRCHGITGIYVCGQTPLSSSHDGPWIGNVTIPAESCGSLKTVTSRPKTNLSILLEPLQRVRIFIYVPTIRSRLMLRLHRRNLEGIFCD